MRKILGYMRKAITDYGMIMPNDTIAVGVSGGKDSMVLLSGLCRLREFMGVDFNIVAITIDPCFGNVRTNYTPVTNYCRELNIEHIIKRSDLGEIIFKIRKESNPCSLCARMRRGMLHDMARENDCNKIALGHHRGDAVETLIMNLFIGGKIGCFQPVTYLSRKDITMIRPMVLASEREIISAARRHQFPVVKSACPVDGKTSRETTKRWIAELERTLYPNLSKKIFGAILRSHIDGW